ncbi:MAG: 2TM domain-containing protein [Actinomycetia bacterium]|nr:2TM domain-containing protein [Actinomycetes bacterium]
MSRAKDAPHQHAAETGEDHRVEAARRYVQKLRVFYIHAGVAATGMVLIFIVNLATNAAAGITGEWWAWWSAWAFIGWSLALAIHGLVVRLERPTHASSTWEQRQIDKVLAR